MGIDNLRARRKARRLARRSRGDAYLIGPELLPAFSALLKICLGTLAVVFLLGVLSNLGGLFSAPIHSGRLIASAVGALFETTMKVIGILVVIFAIIQRAALAQSVPGEAAESPPVPVPGTLQQAERQTEAQRQAQAEAQAQAPPGPAAPDAAREDPDRHSRAGAAFALAGVALALVIVNAFPNWLGGWVFTGDEMGFVPLAGPGFDRWMWLLYVMLTITFVRSLMLFLSGRWTVPTRALDLLDSALLVWWLLALVREADVIQIDPAAMLAEGWSQAAVDKLAELVDGLVRVGLQVGLFGVTIWAGFDVAAKARNLWGTVRRLGT